MGRWIRIRRVDVQVSILTAAVVIVSCLCVFFLHYRLTYSDMIQSLTDRTLSIYTYMEESLDRDGFYTLRSPEDMDTPAYQSSRQTFANAKQATGVRYLYTATQDENGQFIYLVDGLPLDAVDFRRPGDAIEPEIIPELTRAMAGESVLPNAIKDTAWGKIFIAYLPIHDANKIAGVVGVEFEAGSQYHTYRTLLLVTPLVILAACLVSVFFAVCWFRRISNPAYRDFSNTDQLTQLKNRNAFQVDTHNLDALRHRMHAGLLLADLNNLKQVNDQLGHEAGDRYLETAAAAFLAATERGQTAYRVGGDEFAILDLESDEGRLAALAQRIQSEFSALRPTAWPVETSLSLGYAYFDPTQDKEIQDLYHRADGRMYEEKHAYHAVQKNKP